MRKLTLKIKEQKRNAIIYTSVIENNFFLTNFDEQNKICLEYVSNNNYNLDKQYNESLIDNIDIYERNEFCKMLYEIEKYNIKNSVILIYSYEVLGTNINNFTTLVDLLTKREIHIICVFEQINAFLSGDLASLQMRICINKYFNDSINEIYFLFSGKNNSICDENFYKGSFRTEEELKNYLTTVSKNDEWLHVRSPGNMKKMFKYNCIKGNTIKNDINEIMKNFY